MNTEEGERVNETTAVWSLKCILCDGCPFVVTSGAACLAETQLHTSQSSKTAFQEEAAPIPRAESKEKFNGIFDRLFSEERLPLGLG